MNQWLLSFLLAFGVSQVATLAESMYLHRGLAHRSVRYSKPIELALRFTLWITTGIDRRTWVAIHRKHHAHTDVEGDPHSPVLAGFWKIQLFNSIYYWKEAANPETITNFSRDIPEDWLDRHVFVHWYLGLAIGIALMCLILGLPYGIPASAAHLLMFMFINSTVNGLGHTAGYRNFDNTARNSRALALVTLGEMLHNNHHAFPTSPKLSVRASEFDISWLFIRALAWLGLAQPRPTVSLAKLGWNPGQPLPIRIGSAAEEPMMVPAPESAQK